MAHDPQPPPRWASTNQLRLRAGLFVLAGVFSGAVVVWQLSSLAVPRGPSESPPVLYWLGFLLAGLAALTGLTVRRQRWIWKTSLVLLLLAFTGTCLVIVDLWGFRTDLYSPLPPIVGKSALGTGFLLMWLFGVLSLLRVKPAQVGSQPPRKLTPIAVGSTLGMLVAALSIVGTTATVWSAREAIDAQVCYVHLELIAKSIDKKQMGYMELPPTLDEFVRREEFSELHLKCPRHDGEVRYGYLPEYLRERAEASLIAKYGSREAVPAKVTRLLDAILKKPYSLKITTIPKTWSSVPPLPLIWDRTPHGYGDEAFLHVYWQGSFVYQATRHELDAILNELTESLMERLSK